MRQTFNETTDPSFGARALPLVRQAMADQGLDGFLVPHEDEHQNEYLPAANDRLGWLTGFTGSAGAAVVLKDKAAIFVDGRYTLQVRDQVDQALFEPRDLVDGGVGAYLAETVRPGWTIGYDAALHTPDAVARLRAAVETAGARLVSVACNPVDKAWAPTRPAQPQAPIVPHPLDYAGEPSSAKRRALGEALAAQGADAVVLTTPASVAWLFNIRGADVIRTPLPLSQAIVRQDGSAELFLDPAKVTDGLEAWLGPDVSLRAADDLGDALEALSGQKVMLDPSSAVAWYFDVLTEAGAELIRAADPTVLPRAVKNSVEVAGAHAAHARDGAALTRFLHWIATEAQEALPDEIEIVSRLEAFREETGALKDLSFDTIAGAGPNGAIVHYRPVERLNRRTEPGSLLLVDSGGQYLDGTTDVTRTVAIGVPTEEMKERFTLVLKGHLALAGVRFPAGTTGAALDPLARAPLWSAGLDFDHGAGHGVGSYLGVHEGPHGISKRAGGVALQPGMIVSNEPGYYKPGEYGIRIENLQVVTPPSTVIGGERPMLGFEPLTLAPIDRACIEPALMTSEELAQLNAYHARVLDTVGPLLPDDVRTWLQGACAPI
jgi:Xaa-Pro aminopeptidase